MYDNPKLKFKKLPDFKEIKWKSPSNIALVKYWGKKPVQIPMNPSVSFTLQKSATTTKMNIRPVQNKETRINFYLGKEKNELFAEKTLDFFNSISYIFPFIKQLDFEIKSENSFPHSAGIASSASGMSALALCLCDIERTYFNTLQTEDEFYQKASYVARLGSGSAARSIFGGAVLWGEIPYIPESSDFYGLSLKERLHDEFKNYQDTILIVDAGQKKVSSRVGHSLMKTNPFASQRFEQAKTNTENIIKVLETGDIETFIKITESEALTLHAMMMTSTPYFLLIKANTLQIIEKLWEYRLETGIPLSFTLDAGPNVHLLYPQQYKKEIKDFISSELKKYLQSPGKIYDCVGTGPEKLN